MKITVQSSSDNIFIRIANSDENAFRHLFEQHKDQVYNYAPHFTHSTAIAEEITQDVFLKIWLNKDRLTQIRK